MPSARPGTSRLAAFLALLLILSAPVAWAAEPPTGLISAHAGDRQLSWDDAVRQLSLTDVVFLGEQHDDPATHRLERTLLEALHQASGKPLVLSLEMFERDVQPVLDAYLNGSISEADFLARSRPWPNYATDYRPLVEYAKAHGLPVLASNVPRRIASAVAKQGLEALGTLPPEERRFAAAEVVAPRDRLWERFQEMMGSHPGVGEAEIARMYVAQCLKDATMAETIAQRFEGAGPAPLVLHVNGAFHSDEGLGVPAQLRRRDPGLRQGIATVLPREAAMDPPPAGLADIVFVVTRAKRE
jgi:uncharacterized iron-regulated protein